MARTKTPSQKKPEPASFEDAMEQLEDSVSRLESGDLTLEESLEVFEQGIAASRACAQRLKQTRKRVQALVRKHGDGMELEFLDADGDALADDGMSGDEDLSADGNPA